MVTTTLAMMLVTMSDVSDAATKGGEGVSSVALLPPGPSPGGYSASNPTVGIGAKRITPRSARVRNRLLGNPPILSHENGLTVGEGTPRITVELIVGTEPVRTVLGILILLLSSSPVSQSIVVGRLSLPASLSITRSGNFDGVTRTRGRGPSRQVGEGSWSEVRHQRDLIPHTTHVAVGVSLAVTMTMAVDVVTPTATQ